MKKNNVLLFLCIAIFGIAGIYFTFISGNINMYDSQTKAYRIDPNERWDSDGSLYYPIYYFKVNGEDYQCKSKAGSSSIPNQNKNIVYYDSTNPEKCKTEYEKSSSRIGGIICLVVTAVIIILAIKNPSNNTSQNINEYSLIKKVDSEKQYQIDQNIQKAEVIITKIQLIYKRIIIGIIIVVLLVINLIDTAVFKQTIVSKDFIETTATYVNKKDNTEADSIFDDYIYTFKDKQGEQQEIIYSVSKNEQPKDEIKLKYNENNPQDYYEESSIMNKKEFIWYLVRMIVMILLIILFFNKRILSKIQLSTGINKTK